RKRVERSARRDERFLRERLRLVRLSDLKRFEAFEERKVGKLTQSIAQKGEFTNPLSIVREMIVVDGANRLEALLRLGALWAPCVVYDYSDIDLLGNVHFVNGS